MFGQRIREPLAVGQVSGTALASSAAATSIIPSHAKLVLPSQFFDRPGGFLDIFLAGRISTLNPTPGTFTFSLMMGAVAVCSSGALTVNIGAAKVNVAFEARLRATCQVVGPTAQLMFQWVIASEAFAVNSAVAGVVGVIMGPVSAPALGTAFDATANETMDVNGQWGTANAANSIQVHQYIAECG